MSIIPGWTPGALRAPVPPTIVYNGFGYASGNRSSHSISGVAIGAADPKRTVIILTSSRGVVGNPTVSGLTIGGISATQLTGTETPITYWVANVPTGTTATVAWTTSANTFYSGVESWAAYNLRDNDTAVECDSEFSGLGNFDITRSIATENNGVMALYAQSIAGTNATPYSWTNATEDADRTGYGAGTGAGAEHSVAHVEGAPPSSLSVTVSTNDEFTFYWLSMR